MIMFELNNTCYQQLQGSAMGLTLPPAYANIFMSKLEKVFLSQANQSHCIKSVVQMTC